MSAVSAAQDFSSKFAWQLAAGVLCCRNSGAMIMLSLNQSAGLGAVAVYTLPYNIAKDNGFLISVIAC